MSRWKNFVRKYVLGEGVVDEAERSWGHDDSQFSVPAYGDYLATSNGVYSCSQLRAKLVSRMPLKLYRNIRGELREVVNGDLVKLLHKVNPFWTFGRLINMTEQSLCAWGEGYWFLERGSSGLLHPREIWWGRPDRVRVVPHPTKYIAGYLYYPANGAEPVPFRPEEVIWFRYPNPLDEYSALSPMAAARLAADYASAALQSNTKLFAQGLQAGGFIVPREGGPQITERQAEELSTLLDRRFKGMDKAHRWGVLRFDAEVKTLNLSPRDAEFLGGMRWSLEEIARAFGVPLDLIGGQRTYENVEAAMRALWHHTVLPEADFIAEEITEQLLPKFGEADVAKFDSSGVKVLEEEETSEWQRAEGQIKNGALTLNEWRKSKGLRPVAWGNVWWAPRSVQPIRSEAVPAIAAKPAEAAKAA